MQHILHCVTSACSGRQDKTSLNGLKQPFQSTLMISREERTLTIVDIHKTKENGKTILKTKASCGKMSLV